MTDGSAYVPDKVGEGVPFKERLTEPAIFNNSVTLIEALNDKRLFSSPIIFIFFDEDKFGFFKTMGVGLKNGEYCAYDISGRLRLAFDDIVEIMSPSLPYMDRKMRGAA